MRRRFTPLPSLLLGLLVVAGPHPLTAQASPAVRGDPSRDGALTSGDALGILSQVVGLPLPAGWRALPDGDADCDGTLSALDGLIVLSASIERDVSAFCAGERVVVEVRVSPDSLALAPGDSATLSAMLRGPDDDTVDALAPAWSPSDLAVVTVDAVGVVRAATAGSARVVATRQRATDTVRVVVSDALALPVVSAFDTDAEGWTFFADARGLSNELTPTHLVTGGNPDGHIAGKDLGDGRTWYFVAPERFGGDRSGAYGRALAWDLRQSGTHAQFDNDEVVLVGGGLTLTLDAPHPGTSWTSYAAALHENGGWRVGSVAATEAQILQVLSDLQVLRIRGEYISGGDQAHLDNARLGVGVGSVAVTPAGGASAPDTLRAFGATLELRAAVLEAGGDTLRGALPVWSSSDAEVATVDAGGRVTATGNGTARIAASFGSATGSADVVVFVPPLALPLSSTFDTGTEGWTSWTTAAVRSLQHFASGGNPWGYVSESDPDSRVWFFQAPDGWTGNAEGAYGAWLVYDLKQSSTSSQFQAEEVVLVGGGTTLRWDGDHPGTGWTPYAVALDEAGGWTVTGGAAATEAEIRAVLRRLTALRIRGEYVNGGDRGDLDNVAFGVRPAIEVSADSAVLEAAGDTLRLQASVLDQDGAPLPGPRPVAWTSSDTTVVEVDAGGLLTARGPGSATVSAAFAGASRTVPVRVEGIGPTAGEVRGAEDERRNRRAPPTR